MDSQKGILILTPFFRPNIGGVESYLNDLCLSLSSRGYMSYVVTYQPLTSRLKGEKFEKKENLEIHRVWWFGHNWFHKLEPYPLLEFLYLTPCLFIFTYLFMLKNRKKIDCIHAQGLNAAFIAKFLAKIFKKRCVMSTCAIYDFKSKPMLAKITKWTLSSFDKILALADFSKQELLGIGLPAAKIDTYYLWVDQTKYIPADKDTSKQKVNLTGKFIVLFVGRFIKIKGVDILVEVAKKVGKNISFVFIGDDGPYLGFLEKESKEHENIVLIKGLRGQQLIPYYQAADVLIIPSQYEEAFGKVIIEALSCGTPVIGANKGAIPDILDGTVGRIVNPDKENIQKEIEYLHDHPAVLAQLTANCRSYAEKKFSEQNTERIIKSYYS